MRRCVKLSAKATLQCGILQGPPYLTADSEKLERIIGFFTMRRWLWINEHGIPHEQLYTSKIQQNTLVSVPSGTCCYQMGQSDKYWKLSLGSDWPAFTENAMLFSLLFIGVCDLCDKARTHITDYVLHALKQPAV